MLGGNVKEFRLAVQMTFVSTPHGTDEQFEEFIDAVQEQLDSLDVEVQIAAKLTDRIVDIATSTEATSFEFAASRLLMDIRTALHAVGCHTPDWPRFQAVDHHLRELQDA
ncbi:MULTISPECIES: hypothetical protein [unclassified Solwaraspora]|uniref:hypothetical protein n=1 Tax=unclassified Solwaraspora TaxID=2627926 RepID=UPI00248C2E7E|nr:MULTISPECIES: hypothetical protein [unclassified Solwaraspora]WBC19657.1 hypothetical protein O7543_22870 [Solwaraspora sp. WMMA2080]WJK32764.1 hypothetical protein O7610_18720 [Solwaraspora sp. WMMA2065]